VGVLERMTQHAKSRAGLGEWSLWAGDFLLSKDEGQGLIFGIL